MSEPVENIKYTDGANLSKEVLADLNNDLPDAEIIRKLQEVEDLSIALWGEGDWTVPRYAPLHHAASRGRVELLQFILTNRPSEQFVNLVNDNHFTALRYATRNGLESIQTILLACGAEEELAPITILCPCGIEFIHGSDAQARYLAQGFQQPKHCPTCRSNSRARKNGGAAVPGGVPGRGRGRGRGRGGRGSGGRGRPTAEGEFVADA